MLDTRCETRNVIHETQDKRQKNSFIGKAK